MSIPPRPKIALRYLAIHDYKAIDSLELDFPAPRMEGDPDVMVLGSENGLGKTSVLECCALLFLAATRGTDFLKRDQYERLPIDLSDLLVRAGSDTFAVKGQFDVDDSSSGIVTLRVPRTGPPRFDGNSELLRVAVTQNGDRNWSVYGEQLVLSLAGIAADPLVYPPLMYFHSYRKVQEGNPELGTMVGARPALRRGRPYLRGDYLVSAFKVEVLRLLMSRANLFEQVPEEDKQDAFRVLDDLVREYARGTIGRLRPSEDNTLEIRISPDGQGDSFTFDGLSSGQKEIIATLFLIWRHSSGVPSTVLIDEPELHLNPEWQRGFVRRLFELAPRNQYILATHSEDVFESVDADRRILLTSVRGETDAARAV